MSVLETAIGWLAPPQCVGCGLEGFSLCKGCRTSGIVPFGEKCWRCNALSAGGRTCLKCRQASALGSVWITTNHEGLARDILSLYKFGHQRAAVEPIAQLMAETFLRYQEGYQPKEYLVAPIPTATRRIRERGFGHSELLARKIALKLRLDHENALRRLGQSRQLGSKREDRLIQLENNFAVKNPHRVAGRDILLVDDVITTGGTLQAAAKTLRAAGARQVNALLFAKHL